MYMSYMPYLCDNPQKKKILWRSEMILSLYNKSLSYRSSTPFKQKNLLFYFFRQIWLCLCTTGFHGAIAFGTWWFEHTACRHMTASSTDGPPCSTDKLLLTTIRVLVNLSKQQRRLTEVPGRWENSIVSEQKCERINPIFLLESLVQFNTNTGYHHPMNNHDTWFFLLIYFL